MSANLVTNVVVSGSLTGGGVAASNVFQFSGPETLTASGAMNPYLPSVLRPPGASTPGYTAGMTFTSSGYAESAATTTDSNGNIYVAGYYVASAAFPIYNLSTSPNGSATGYNLPSTGGASWSYFIKYNASGTYQYSTVLPTGSGSEGAALACDQSGNVYMVGTVYSTSSDPTLYNASANPATSSSGSTLPTSPYGSLAYIIKYNSSGAFIGRSILGDGGSIGRYARGTGVACDSAGNVYVCGVSNGNTGSIYNIAPTYTGSVSLQGSNPYDGPYLAKFNAAGTALMSVILRPSSGSAGGVACDSDNNVYFTGRIGGGAWLNNMSTDGGAGFYMNTPYQNSMGFLIKYNSSGTYQSSIMLNANMTQQSMSGFSVAVDSSKNVYFCGTYNSASSGVSLYNFDYNPSNPTGGSNYLPGSNPPRQFIIKYNSSGTYQYSTVFPTSSYSQARNIKCDSSGSVYMCGTYDGSPILYNMAVSPLSSSSGNSFPTVPSGGAWPYLISYNTSGAYRFSTVLDLGTNASYGLSLATDPYGSIYFAGTYYGNPTIYVPSASPNTTSSGYSLPSIGSTRSYLIKYMGASISAFSMTLPNLGTSVTSIVEKPIYVNSGASTTITENSNVFTVPASANVAVATWTTDRWIVTYS